MTQCTALEAHTAACREAMAAGRERPTWRGGSLRGADLIGADLASTRLRSADLSGADLAWACLIGADLSGANLRGANFCDANLRSANLRGATLTDADLSGATLLGANLSRARLAGATLIGAIFFRATLTDTDLSGARLSEGVACGHAIGGHAGGYDWWAVGLEDGRVVLQYGCERAPLDWWLAQGPELCVRHGHPAEFWVEGPAVAIAAAQALTVALGDQE